MPKNKSYEVRELGDRPYQKFSSLDLGRDRPGETAVLSCNDAVARGAIEAGVRIAACYPGAPLTYVLEALAGAAAAFPEMHVEWSANEKCSYETALGGAMCGLRSMCIMKNVGVPWILDSLSSSSMLGVAGLVIVVADDPGAETTQAEEDCRLLARFAEVPVLEPGTLQETKDTVRYAFGLSEQLAIPVMVRLTVRQGYARALVTLGEIDHDRRRQAPRFTKSTTSGWTGYPAIGWPETGPALLHKRFHGEAPAPYLDLMRPRPTERAILEAADACPFNVVSDVDGARLCVVTAGLAAEEVREAVALLDATDVAVVTLGITLPVPPRLVSRLLARYSAILIVEETEPVIEDQVRVLASEVPSPARIYGKRSGHVPYSGEVTSDLAADRIAALLGRPSPLREQALAYEDALTFVRERVPFKIGGQFCVGCPETAPTLTLRKVLDDLPGPGIACGDSGCGFIAQYAPIRLTNTFICMGAGLGVAQGISHTGIGKIAAVMGDSTFYHSGITELINAVYNRANVLLMILDNKSTAETGQQPHPGAFGITATKKPTRELQLEDLVRACQVDYLKVVDSYDVKALEAAYREAMAVEGVCVVIARGTCALIVDRQRKEQRLRAEAASAGRA